TAGGVDLVQGHLVASHLHPPEGGEPPRLGRDDTHPDPLLGRAGGRQQAQAEDQQGCQQADQADQPPARSPQGSEDEKPKLGTIFAQILKNSCFQNCEWSAAERQSPVDGRFPVWCSQPGRNGAGRGESVFGVPLGGPHPRGVTRWPAPRRPCPCTAAGAPAGSSSG